MKREDLFRAMEDVDEDLVLEAGQPRRRRPPILRWAAAACLVLALGVSAMAWRNGQNLLPLERSQGVRVSYAGKVPQQAGISGDLITLTEAELFHQPNAVVFQGEVEQVENICIRFGSEAVYRALATLRVETVYQGSCKAGDTVTVLLPCPVGTGVWVEDTDTVSAMELGMKGIFMPMAYQSDSTWKENGKTLYLKDLADYGFADGERYAFLQGRSGLIFSGEAYPSLAEAQTLEDVEDFVLRMLP